MSSNGKPVVDSGVTNGRRAGFRPDIQGLRAVAVLLVVAYHAQVVLPGGFVGVDVFFVLSGYVITRMLANELGTSGRVDFVRFYLRRVRRLLPALALLLVFVLLAGIFLGPLAAQERTARTGASAALLNANTYLMRFGAGGGYFGDAAESNALLHIWSLSVEEQFYLVFPALLVGVWVVASRRERNPLAVTARVLGLIFVGSFVLSWLLTTERLDPFGFGSQVAFYSAPTRAWEFAAGGILAVGAARMARLNGRWAWVATVAGAGLLLVAGLTLDANTSYPGTAALLPVLGTALLIAAGEPDSTNRVKRALSVQPMQSLGDLSYSWYLWHWPIIVFAEGTWPDTGGIRVIAAAGSLLPAWLAYRFVESPIRFGAAPVAKRTVALGALCVLAPLAAAGALTAAHGALTRTDKITPFEAHEDFVRGCHASTSLDADESRCVWPVPNASGAAVLVGDSNAGQHTEGFVAAANAVGLDALVATRSNCPFVDLEIFRDGEEEVGCASFVAQALVDLEDQLPQAVFIASASDGYVETEAWTFGIGGGSDLAETPDEKAVAWKVGLGRVVARLEAAGIEVVIVHPVPKPPNGWRPSERSPIRLLGPTEWTNTSFDRAEALEFSSRAVAAEQAAAGTTASTIDLSQSLCPGEQCRTYDGTTWLYRDAGHITVAASLMLADVFEAALSGGGAAS